MVLAMTDVTVNYDRLTAVDRVSLDVAQGEVLALLGPSGCGKSTLLRAIAGLEPLTSGRITFDNQDLAGIPVHQRGFGLMFQDGVLFPHRTVAGNIAYGLVRRTSSKVAIRARVEELLDLVGLPGYADRPVAELSGGEQQRVALARSLAPQPKLLLLDEPLAALDAGLRERLLMDLGRILQAAGTTAVFVTHDQEEAFAIADTVAVMREGRVEQAGPLRQVWDQPLSEWIARFVGYSSVIQQRGQRLALRPSALRVDPGGEYAGIVTGVSARPEVTLLTVAIPQWGSVFALADPDQWGADSRIEDPVQLRLDPRFTAVIPS